MRDKERKRKERRRRKEGRYYPPMQEKEWTDRKCSCTHTLYIYCSIYEGDILDALEVREPVKISLLQMNLMKEAT